MAVSGQNPAAPVVTGMPVHHMAVDSGVALTVHSNWENRPCDPVVRNETTPSSVLRLAERDDLCRRVDLIEAVLEQHRLRLVATADPLDDGLQPAGDRRAFGGAFVNEVDGAELGRLTRGDERRQLLPRPAGPSGEDRFERAALLGRRRVVDDDRLQPAAVDHALRCVERDDGSRARQRRAIEQTVVHTNCPVALAALVRAVLAEVHVTGADQGTRAVFDEQSASPPRRDGCRVAHASCSVRADQRSSDLVADGASAA